MAITKKGLHAIEYGIFCSGWHYVRNENFEGGYCWRNAPEGWVPNNEGLLLLTEEQHYKLFLKQTQNG